MGTEGRIDVDVTDIPQSRSSTAAARLTFGLSTTILRRHLNILYQVRNVPPFSSTSPGLAPHRTRFIRDELLAALVCYFVVDLASLGGPLENAQAMFGPAKIPFFSRWLEVLSEDIGVRIFSTTALWLNLYCMVRIMYRVTSVVTVSIGIWQVKD